MTHHPPPAPPLRDDLPDGISPADAIVAVDVPLEAYLSGYADARCEWVEGMVIQLSPAELRHNAIDRFLYVLLDTYFALRPIGRVIPSPFMLRQPAFPQRRREPDLMVVLHDNRGTLHRAYFEGVPEIIIEIASPESEMRDRGAKFLEYQQGGVPEYWLVIPDEAVIFYRLVDGAYLSVALDETIYTTPLLPDLRLDADLLLRDPLPQTPEVVSMVTAMVGTGDGKRP